MKSVLLIGLGDFGFHVAEKLSELGHEILAVDICEDKVNKILSLVTNAQIGDSTDREFLESLGVDNFDLCICTIGESFQNSLETTSLLRELGASRIISRASNNVHEKFLLRNGADSVIYPEKQLARWAAIRFTANHVLDYVELDENHSIFEVEVPMEWYGKTVGQLDIRKKYGVSIIGIKRSGKMSMSITPDTVFYGDETILTVGAYKDVQKCFKL